MVQTSSRSFQILRARTIISVAMIIITSSHLRRKVKLLQAPKVITLAKSGVMEKVVTLLEGTNSRGRSSSSSSVSTTLKRTTMGIIVASSWG